MIRSVLLGLLLLRLLAPAAGASDRDVAALVDGVGRLALTGVPGPLVVCGERAFHVVVGKSGDAVEPVVAAARFGRGRVVAFGHGGYLNPEVEGAGRLLENAVRWAGRVSNPHVLVEGNGRLARALAEAGIRVVDETGPEIDVIVADAARLTADTEVALIRRFVRKGGGYVTASLGWGWLQTHPGQDLVKDHHGNRLLAEAGIVWADGYLAATRDGAFAVDATPPALAHAGEAWKWLVLRKRGREETTKQQGEQVARVLTRAVRSLSPDDRLLLPKLRAEAARATDAPLYPVAGRPLGAVRPLERVLLAYDLHVRATDAARSATPHPAAADFPGVPPRDAPRVRRTLRVDTAVRDWHSTGLYAAPGDEVVVTLAETAARLGLSLRIGAHADRLWHKKNWDRCPEITRVVPLASAETRVRTSFGGLVYVVVPKGAPLGVVPLVIDGAVEAPRYVHGRTDPQEWQESLRHLPAPWAEVESDRIIVTVPSEVVRDLDDPARLMETWNRILDLDAELAARPIERARPERIVCDRQISAGYMHAGYPIMVHLDQIRNVVDADHLAGPGNWGLYHELGHNHQHRDWTFGGTGEVTCNLFTLYVLEHLCGVDLDAASRMSKDERAKQMAKFDFGAPDFDRWKRSPFLALVMYVQLQRAFGWEAYREVFAEYRALDDAERPKNDGEKRDQWMVRFSRTVGRNLGPFFVKWGVPVSDAALKEIEGLPAWSCSEMGGKEGEQGKQRKQGEGR